MEFESRDPEILRIYNVTTDAEAAQLAAVAPQFYWIRDSADKTFDAYKLLLDRYYGDNTFANRKLHDVEDQNPKYGVDGIPRKIRMMTRTQMYLDNPIPIRYVHYDLAGHSEVHSHVRQFSRFG